MRSQNPVQDNSSKKIGLVLSGGGAKGFAHIGVLKVIDSLNIKIDYIAGTSMGAIVGSLYASGYSGRQLDSIFNSLNFDEVINDYLPRKAKTFYEKDNSEKYAVSLPFDEFKLTLPKSLSRGQNIYNLLSKLTLHVSEIDQFENLPIPFFCIATDIETGQEVYLDSGNLPQVIKASASFPSLFAPVNIKNRLLVDGGITNNYPIDELKQKGMEIIIGVDVQDSLVDRKNLKSATDILLQVSNLPTINAMIEKSKATDVYVKPNIDGFTVMSFSKGREIIDRGEAAARLKVDDLNTLPKRIKAWENTINIVNMDSIPINNIYLSGNERYSRSYVLGKLKIKSNQITRYSDFSDGVNNLVATNNFDAFDYYFKKSDETIGYDLYANLEESENSMFVKLALHYDNLYKTGLLANFTKKHLIFGNDVLSLDFVLGDNVRYNFDYFIDKGFYWSIGLTSRFNQFNRNIPVSIAESALSTTLDLSGVNKLEVDYEDFTNQLYVQTLFSKSLALRLGFEHKHLKFKTETLTVNPDDEDFVFENSDYLSFYGSLILDNYDDKFFPTSGWYFKGDFNLYVYGSGFNADFEEYSIAKADIGFAFDIVKKVSANISTQGGFKIGDKSTRGLDFALGGDNINLINNLENFYGYDYLSLMANSFVKAELALSYQPFKGHYLSGYANIANVEDNLFETGQWATWGDYSGFGLGYNYSTFIGPLGVVFSYSPEVKRSYWNFNLGFRF